MKNWENKIFLIKGENKFNAVAIEAFHFQYNNNPVYHEYCDRINKNPESISHYKQIPFLPIEFFKTHNVFIKSNKPQFTFTSSGTTGMQTSKHHVADIKLYEQSFVKAFEQFYGNINDYCILALLPSYLEREGSSLVYMAKIFIDLSNHNDSGFYLHNYKQLAEKLDKLSQTNQKILLLGVTYALLDLAEQYPQKLNNTIIMETGGMKGRRKELIRKELHETLCKAFKVKNIHSEYGMTELLSQAYSKAYGVFETPPWMKIIIRDTYDPFTYYENDRSGGINIIDLTNINSCCFIETKDLGKTFSNNTFTVLGRFDNTDIRGCNLMVG